MKIENLLDKNLISPESKINDKKENNDFLKLFEQTKNKNTVPFLPEINRVNNSFLKERDYIINQQVEGIGICNNLLDKIEIYQKALENPEVPLNNLEDLSNSIMIEVGKIKDFCEHLSFTNPLRKILYELEIFATVEVLKFKYSRYI